MTRCFDALSYGQRGVAHDRVKEFLSAKAGGVAGMSIRRCIFIGHGLPSRSLVAAPAGPPLLRARTTLGMSPAALGVACNALNGVPMARGSGPGGLAHFGGLTMDLSH